LCKKVCPFISCNDNEDAISEVLYSKVTDISHRSECGYVLNTWVGSCSDRKTRLNGASGGVATWFLNQLFAEGIIDRAICITKGEGIGNLFNYEILENSEGLDSAAKSAYYPVELSAVIRTVINTDARYAVVCLPCFAKAIRLAQKQIPVLAKRIVVIVGLTCGHSVSTLFSEYAAVLASAPVDKVNQIIFRVKTSSLPASELGTTVMWTDDKGIKLEKTIYWSDGLGEAWSGHWFTPRACLYCDDVFAETADIALMDAWLPEYVQDYRGHSIVIARSEIAGRIINLGICSKELELDEIPTERVVESQKGVVDFKHDKLAHRLWNAHRSKQNVPTKRVSLRRAGNWYAEMLWDAEAERSRIGVQEWIKSSTADEFRRKMQSITGRIPLAIKLRRIAGKVLSAGYIGREH
jgi:coenzyme F420-reducing hydrogenase beta subunit